MTLEEARFPEGVPTFQSFSNQSPLDMSHSHSINTISSIRDYIISEDLLAGQRLDGRMSNVRRFFCLFVTFDFLFISLMWLICLMLNGGNILNMLNEQILHYNIHKSLFDIVLVAFCRFLVLIFFYAVLYINHWIVISLSTGLSCAFLIGKVFVFDWPKSSQPIFEVLLILASFILCWSEAWFMDFRVLPQENHANRYLITATESERAPLIRSYVQNLPSTYTESVGNFYSPLASPEGSLYRGEAEQPEMYPVRLTQEQEDYYKISGARALQCAWDLYQRTDWKLERQDDQYLVFLRKDSKAGTIFRLETEISTSPRYLLDELYFGVANLAKWTKSVKESHKVQTIDEHTDITYQVSEVGAGGLVGSRDFVSLRHWDCVEDTYIMSCSKCDHPKLPPSNKYIRGENGIGGYIIKTIPNEDNKCRLIWIINPNLNIKVPRFILDKEVMKMMIVFAQELKDHIHKSSEIK